MGKKRNFTDGLRLRKDGVWERTEIIGEKRRSFSSKDPETVWNKIEAAKTIRDKGPLFQEVAEAYRDNVVASKAHGTQKVYGPAIKRAVDEFGAMHMRDIQSRDITMFLRRQSNMAAKTVANQKTVVNAIYEYWIQDEDWRGDYEPCRLARIPSGLQSTEREPPTEQQLKIVLAAADEPSALPAVVFLYTGMRRGEALALQRKDIDFKTNTISVTKSVEHIGNRPHITTTKTKSGVRSLPLLAPLQIALQPLKSASPETYIIGGKDRPITQTEYKNLWTGFCRTHGMAHAVKKNITKTRNGQKRSVCETQWLPDITAHQFRHEYITMLFEAGVSEDVAIALAGHADGKTIHKVYLHLRARLLQSAAEKLNAHISEVHDKLLEE